MIVVGDRCSRFFVQVFGECDWKSTGARVARRRSQLRKRLVGWAKRSVPTTTSTARMVGTLALCPPYTFSTPPRYLPLVSTFCFSSSFIFLTTGSRLASPVVLFVVAGEASLGMEVWPDGVVAGRVAVA